MIIIVMQFFFREWWHHINCLIRAISAAVFALFAVTQRKISKEFLCNLKVLTIHTSDSQTLKLLKRREIVWEFWRKKAWRATTTCNYTRTFAFCHEHLLPPLENLFFPSHTTHTHRPPQRITHLSFVGSSNPRQKCVKLVKINDSMHRASRLLLFYIRTIGNSM